jgi:cytoskeletal protein RodZ
MSSNQNPNPYPDYRSAAQWAHNYTHNPNGNGTKDNSINIFWIVVVALLLALAVWWWWNNYRSNIPTSDPEKKSSPIEDLKNGAQKPGTTLIVKPNGTVVSS